jgi:hypothetical protein
VRDLHHLVSTFFVDQISQQPVVFAGPTRPIADPGRPIEALAGLTGPKLDRFVADGMGIDLDALTKASDAVGVVAALAETEVPVGQRDTVDEATFAALRDGLSSEVLRLAEMAMPELRVRSGPLDAGPAGGPAGGAAGTASTARTPRRTRTRRRPQRQPDALDELLSRLEDEGADR